LGDSIKMHIWAVYVSNEYGIGSAPGWW